LAATRAQTCSPGRGASIAFDDQVGILRTDVRGVRIVAAVRDEKASQRDKIAERVRALLAMNTENGCSEAEAMTAAAMAGRLMRDYDLSIDDVQAVKDEAVSAHRSRYSGKKANPPQLHPAGKYCAVAVGAFFDCKVWRNRDEIVFFGVKQDTELAHAMLSMIQASMDKELKAFRKAGGTTDGASVHVQNSSFILGMANRLAERISHLKRERSQASEKGTSLVVVKTELVTEAYARQFGSPPLKKSRFKSDAGSEAAYGAGYVVGDRVAIAQGELSRPTFNARSYTQQMRDAATRFARDTASWGEQRYSIDPQSRAMPRTAQPAKHALMPLSAELREIAKFTVLHIQTGLGAVFIMWWLGAAVGYLPQIPDSKGDWRGTAGTILNLLAFTLVWLCILTALKVRASAAFDVPGERLSMIERIGFSAGTLHSVARYIRDRLRRSG
jgi:hypothetical protein